MDQEQIIEHFRSTGALLEGHFLLSSGLHSPQYLQCALALQYTADASAFGHAIARRYYGADIDTVASPAIGGLVIGYAVAAALNVRFIWTEREAGKMTLRRGFTIQPGERILVGADVIGAASIIDRSNGKADVGVPRVSLATLDVPSYSQADCPMCAGGSLPI